MGIPRAMGTPWPWTHWTPMEFFYTTEETLPHHKMKVLATAQDILPRRASNTSAPLKQCSGVIKQNFLLFSSGHLDDFQGVFWDDSLHLPGVAFPSFQDHVLDLL